MIRFLNGAALGAGLAAAGWVAATHAGSHPAVLPMLALIMAAFLAGVAELHRYRADTQSLVTAVAQAQAAAPSEIEHWLATVPDTLRAAIRQRLRGERAALPGPALTPYLTGLLVLLGLLGTFIGMVATLGGTVAALGASADLQAVRLALAAPVQGLGLAFGTSVAGVAASAALGLMAALARGERTQASRALDAALATSLRPHTEDHRRELMLRALQASAEQGQWLPQVAQRMEAALLQVAADSRAAGEALTRSQGRFQEETAAELARLGANLSDRFDRSADALERGLREAALQSSREAHALIMPVVDAGVRQWLDRADAHQQALAAQLADLHQRVADGAASVHQRLLTATAAFTEQAAAQASAAGAALGQVTERVERALGVTTEATQGALRETAERLTVQLAAAAERSDGALADSASRTQEALRETAAQLHDLLIRQAEGIRGEFAQQTGEAFGHFLERFEQRSTDWLAQAAREQAERQDGLTTAATEAMAALRQQTADSLARETAQLAERERLLGAVDTLMQALQHAATEQRQALDGLLASAAEKLRLSAERFDGQTSQVAATLAAATEQATGSLSAATAQAAGSLAAATEQAASSLAAATEQAAASSQTLAAVGEGFAQALQGFGQVNQSLGEQLARVEAALGQHLARSDEQLAYYVAQAREVIELTLGAQQQLLEDLRRVSRGAALKSAA